MADIEIEGPDGSSFSFPEGTPHDTITSAMQKHYGKSPAPEQPPHDMSWTEVGAKAWQSAPSSAAKFAGEVVQPILHPIDTLNAAKNVGEGVLEKTGLMSGKDEIPYADAVGKYFSNRYGSMENFKRSLAEDPVGVAADLSTVLTAGGSLAERAPGMIGKIGGVVSEVGDALNPASVVAGPVSKVAGKLSSANEIVAPSIEELKAAASSGYDHPSIKELELKPGAIQDWKHSVAIGLNDDGFDDVLAPKTFGVLAKLESPPDGAFVSGQSLNTLRKKLGKVASSPDATERNAASRAIKSLDDYTANIPQQHVMKGDPKAVSDALGEARGNYAAAMRSQTVDDAVSKADLQAASANSGMNVDNATRQRFKSILMDPKKRRGFSQDEIAQMTKIVRGSTAANLARRAGNMLGGGGGLGATVSAAGGDMLAGKIGALAPVVGYGLKKLSSKLTEGDVTKLQEMVRQRSPLGEQTRSSLEKWAKAQRDASTSANARKLSQLVIATRNLSRNLADAGISASPESILGSSTPSDQTPRQLTIHGGGSREQPTQ